MTDRVPLWIDLRAVPDADRSAIEAAAQAAGCEHLLVADEFEVDGRPGRVLRVASAADQERAAQEPGIVVVDAADWRVIPLENLIAARRDRPDTLYALARSPDEAVLFRDTLEVGVHGIVLAPAGPDDVAETDHRLRARGPRTPDAPGDDAERPMLEAATVTAIHDAGPGDRVCIDTTSLFGPGEGLLVGSTARSFVLVHAETLESEYVAARPFRVNAGAVHAYLLMADGKTQYLSEAAAGQRVLAVDPAGANRELTIGRAKIERRPHTLVRWQAADGRAGHMVLQTAETVRLVAPDGTAVAVTDLTVGQEVLVHFETAARHFGMPVAERLTER